MKNNPFVDPAIVPDDAMIGKILGNYHPFWIDLFKRISLDYPDISGSWKYYKDVRSWLLRMMMKSKTIFWLSLEDDTFRVTFYFNAKNEHVVSGSSALPAEFKKLFRESSIGKKYKAMTVVVNKSGDIDAIMTLIGLKLSCR